MSRQPLLAIFALLPLLVTACVDETTPTSTPTASPTVTPIPITATPAATRTPPFPTANPPTLTTYRHRSGVFTIPRPSDWDAFDDSSDQRLLVRFIPPVGFGSRITVDITSPGLLTPDEMHGEAESYITRNYAPNPAYRESSRGDLPDGRFQVVYAYNDGRGAVGTETLTVQQADSFFVVLRVFVADTDRESLGPLVDSITSGFTVDPRATWGASVGAINPAELLIVNSLLWQISSDRGYYYGEVYNASPSAIANVKIKISICDKSGVVMSELTQPATLKQMTKGGTIPFVFTLDKPQRGITVCAQSASADPAQPDPSYTTSLTVQLSSRVRGGFALAVEGQVINPGLSPVQDIHVVIVVYDARSTVIGLTEITSTPDLQLQPGQSLPLKYTFESLGGKADHIATLVEAATVSPTNPSLNP